MKFNYFSLSAWMMGSVFGSFIAGLELVDKTTINPALFIIKLIITLLIGIIFVKFVIGDQS